MSISLLLTLIYSNKAALLVIKKKKKLTRGVSDIEEHD